MQPASSTAATARPNGRSDDERIRVIVCIAIACQRLAVITGGHGNTGGLARACPQYCHLARWSRSVDPRRFPGCVRRHLVGLEKTHWYAGSHRNRRTDRPVCLIYPPPWAVPDRNREVPKACSAINRTVDYTWRTTFRLGGGHASRNRLPTCHEHCADH